MITANLRAAATFAFFRKLRLAIEAPQCFKAVHWVERLSITLAAANRAVRVSPSRSWRSVPFDQPRRIDAALVPGRDERQRRSIGGIDPVGR
jgi:hypothetical protein